MCLGIPGRVTEIADEGGMPMARVDFGGIEKDVCLAYTPETGVGDYVIVHVGFAVTRLDEEEARRTFAILQNMGGEAGPVLAPSRDGGPEGSLALGRER